MLWGVGVTERDAINVSTGVGIDNITVIIHPVLVFSIVKITGSLACSDLHAAIAFSRRVLVRKLPRRLMKFWTLEN